ncbi:MAG: hypothetical protein M1825_003551 [Sarcosagium campestre]|nr:MAG: hypothetical protein M1825_003551 [Sarcosagium campestre]
MTSTNPPSQQQQQQQPIDLASLPIQSLSSIKKQLDEELEHLTSSFSKLRAAQTKFRDCLRCIADGVGSGDTRVSGGAAAVAETEEGATESKAKLKQILVPLTSSLYVPGTMAPGQNVIVDVGTGFYVEKTTEDATIFYDAKVEELGANLKDLEAIVQGKSNNLRVVEEVLRQKVISGSTANNAALASSAG